MPPAWSALGVGIDIERGEGGIALRFRPIDCRHAYGEQDAHHGEEGPALALVVHHPAEHVGQRGGDPDQQQHLNEVGERGRVFVGMGGVRIEEPAAVGAEDLDHFLRGDRSLGYRLLGALQGRRIDIGVQILRHALPDEEKGYHHRNRQQDVERAAGEIDPKIADAARLAPGKAANQGDRQSYADRGRDEIMDSKPRHLDEVAHRGFRHVGLPVRVGDEAHRGVEGQHLLHPGLPLRVERQIPLQALQRVESDEAGDAEEHHRHRISPPGLLLGLVDAATPIDEGARPDAAPVSEASARLRTRGSCSRRTVS